MKQLQLWILGTAMMFSGTVGVQCPDSDNDGSACRGTNLERKTPTRYLSHGHTS
jgi:hypothetical protein